MANRVEVEGMELTDQEVNQIFSHPGLNGSFVVTQDNEKRILMVALSQDQATFAAGLIAGINHYKSEPIYNQIIHRLGQFGKAFKTRFSQTA